ncbi:putative F-box protein At1g49610 isoform X2 [Lycium barbarum]|uniref:putative F-box protein At1g49610 isoform X2 n=1 Tax=Lycium barbarum TaxID=112863 RepID=UPI00293E6E02|nr:putative F-box protein At1g49610 isoform X2 [Lycium barbarum]XP_060195585.1 putative F-box protein At1g49610 isoform X2 [Lycium barbarum]XP_060195593.1 putative F-box protein At1g49610 isoform X2 [Lycium barbarum]
MDRLSALPESVLLHILSFLTTRDVVKTAVLSKRWPHLWTIIQELNFDYRDLFPYQDFVDFVDRTLLSRGTCKIRRLRIRLFLNASSCKDYDGWIFYAAKNNVEELFLDFDSDCCDWLPPKCVYCNSSLKTLSLWSCRLIPDMQISWNLLTKLTLWFSVLWDHTIHKIMVGAPKLEFLELGSCWGYDDLNFDSPSLRVLIVRERESGVYELGPVMRISAPNVQSLHLSGDFYRKLVLMNVPSVVRATLDFHPYTHSDRQKKNLKWQQDNLMELGRSLKHVESLTLGTWCVEVLAQREKRCIPTHISTHKCVTLSVPMREDDLLGTINLLKGSPDLQMLIIDMESIFWEEPRGTELADFNGANYLASQAKHIKCLLHNLKTVKITQFVAQHSVFPFLEFILKNGRVLENLVIVAKRGIDANSPESLLKVAQRLLSLPRASSQAVVTLLN